MLRYSREVKMYPQKYLIGVDEVGRGPIAGPVTIGVFCVEQKNMKAVTQRLKGITDSKQLRPAQREQYLTLVKQLSLEGKCSYATASVSAKLIDTRGISWAIKTALKRALQKIGTSPEDSYVFLDGSLYAPDNYLYQETIIKGDVHNPLIATASVIAKVTRDAAMVRLSKKYPEYLFEQHKGYGTRKHYDAIKENGACEIHRKMWIT